MRVPIVASHKYFCRLFWPMEDKTLLIVLYSYSFLSLTCEQLVVLRACVCFSWISQVHIGWFDPRINYIAYRLKLLLNSQGAEESYLALCPVKSTLQLQGESYWWFQGQQQTDLHCNCTLKITENTVNHYIFQLLVLALWLVNLACHGTGEQWQVIYGDLRVHTSCLFSVRGLICLVVSRHEVYNLLRFEAGIIYF